MGKMKKSQVLWKGILFWGPFFLIVPTMSEVFYPLLEVINAASAAEEDSEKATNKSDALADKEKDSDKPKPLDKVVPDATKIPGLITMFRKKDNLFAEVGSGQLNKDFIIVVSIAKGIGNGVLYTGQTWDIWDGDMIWQFRKVDDRIQIVRRNYRYQADSGTTEEKSVKLSFTDSIIFSLPIVAIGPSGGDVVDLTPIFMSDLPGISRYALRGFSFAKDRSNWEKVKGFAENVEIEVAATYSSGNDQSDFDGLVLDGRGLTVNVHYSISKLPDSGYKSRYADERVGYFTTAIKNLNKNADDGNFVRYINRWNLQKLEPDADVSLPKKPIVFWLDKTIPYQYRKPIRDGILEWNKAFEEAGFYNAIEVRQQEENDTWDPEDIRYNTIRWSSANMGFAIGPSRVNPMTGEILDADVVLDVGFINSWNQGFEVYSPSELAKAFCGRSDLIQKVKNPKNEAEAREILSDIGRRNVHFLDESLFYSQQMGMATAYFDVMSCADLTDAALCDEKGEGKEGEEKGENEKAEEEKKTDGQDAAEKEGGPEDGEGDKKDDKELKVCVKCGKPIKEEEKAETKDEAKADKDKKEDEKEVAQDEKSDKEKETGDQSAEKKETEFCSCPKPNYETERKKLISEGLRWVATHEVGHTLGLRHNFKLSALHSIDEINKFDPSSKYGYGGSIMEYIPANIMPEGEKQGDYYPTKLGEYDYWTIKYGYKTFSGGTDAELKELKKIASEQTKPENNYATDEDCYVNGDPMVNVFDLGDPLEFARLRVRLFNQILPGLNDRIVKDGESYRKLKSRFYALFNDYGRAMYFASRFVGGLEVHRDFKGDKDARPTFVPTPAAKQREALDFVTGELFSMEPRRFSPNLLNYLAPNRWLHWGSTSFQRYDDGLEELILTWQQTILGELLSAEKLGRIADSEYRVEPGTDILSIGELFDKLTSTIFAELDPMTTGDFTPEKPAVSSVRRNLQREYFTQMAGLALQEPNDLYSILFRESQLNDISSLARHQLEVIREKIEKVQSGEARLDPYSKAHLAELKARIVKALDASVVRSY